MTSEIHSLSLKPGLITVCVSEEAILTTLSFSFLFCKTGIINLHHTNLVRIK